MRDHSSSLSLRDRSLLPHVFENIITFETLSNYVYIRIVLKYFDKFDECRVIKLGNMI